MFQTVNYWYRNKYKLTLNDPRYLDTTDLDRLTDYWAQRYLDDPKLLQEIEDESFDKDAILAEWGDEPEPADPDEVDDWEEI